MRSKNRGMDDGIAKQDSVAYRDLMLFSPDKERGPLNLPQKRNIIALPVFGSESCSKFLNRLQLLNISNLIGVPYRRAVVQYWRYYRLIKVT